MVGDFTTKFTNNTKEALPGNEGLEAFALRVLRELRGKPPAPKSFVPFVVRSLP
jgi:hypothetical protein